MNFENTFSGKRVLLTGHTGFKGAWLAEWLKMLGAEVTGLSLDPPTDPSMFALLDLASRLDHRIGNINEPVLVKEVVEDVQPDFVFHLAAQPLVRLSYEIPIGTFSTNVMGTAHVLDALRNLKKPCAAVMVTTDKCYENREWLHSYREEDPMGGYDPYSASKGCAELVINSFRRSYFSQASSPVKIASARAGNVIGGGDYAADRIIPDCVRALTVGNSIPVRNKTATRPWQHVLEPLSGYLALGSKLMKAARKEDAPPGEPPYADFATGFNFAPNLSSNRTVQELVREVLKSWPGSWSDEADPDAHHEASKLNLSYDRAFHLLKWQPRWDFSTTVERTISWYRGVESGMDSPVKLTRRHISEYTSNLPVE